MTTFAESITTLLSTYDNCLALLKSFKHHRQATSGGASDPDAASAVAAQTRLRRSIRSDRTRISRAYEARLSQSGTLLKKGDARARSCLRRVMRRLSAALTRVLRTATGSPEPVIDYESLASLSNASRVDAIKAIDGLSRRISDSGGLAQKGQQQPGKARAAKSHSSLKSDWSSARSQASSSSGKDRVGHHKMRKKDKEGRATLQKERGKEKDREKDKEKEKEKLKKEKHRGDKSHAHKKGYAQHHQHFLPEDPRNQTWDEREYHEAMAEAGDMDESFHDHYYTTAPPPPPPPKSPPPPPRAHAAPAQPDHKAAAAATAARAPAAPVTIHATVPLPVSITVEEPEPMAPADPPPHSPPLSPQSTLRPGSPRGRTTPTSPKRVSIASFTSDVTKLGEIVRQPGLDTVVDEEFEIQPVYPLRPYAPPAPARKKGFWSRLAGRS